MQSHKKKKEKKKKKKKRSATSPSHKTLAPVSLHMFHINKLTPSFTRVTPAGAAQLLWHSMRGRKDSIGMYQNSPWPFLQFKTCPLANRTGRIDLAGSPEIFQAQSQVGQRLFVALELGVLHSLSAVVGGTGVGFASGLFGRSAAGGEGRSWSPCELGSCCIVGGKSWGFSQVGCLRREFLLAWSPF